MMISRSSNTINMIYNAFNANNKAIEDTARTLSTGLRTASAADDAAGFAMGMNISAQIAGVDRAVRNSQDGISMLQTAEGALSQINSMLQRMRELAVQSASDVLTTQDRGYIQLEIDELKKNIDNVASNTTFNCKRLLDGSSSAIWSSDDAKTKLSVSGAVTSIDQFGQKKPVAGNYKIEITAKAGSAEVQKSQFFEYENSASLREMSAFINSSGAFILNDPQKVKIIQGDGKTAEIVLYSEDTLNDVSSKINNAIADDLGQARYADNRENFCSLSITGSRAALVISSAVAGSEGKLTFTSENNDLINALNLNTIQEAEENRFSVSIYDAHTDKTIAENITPDGNRIDGVISPNIALEFDTMSNVKSVWDNASKRYILQNDGNSYSTIVHIDDRSTSFQIGQNLGEDIYINIGDMRAEALGLNKIDVSTRKRASEALTLLDQAIHKVSSQRSKIGAHQNELEYNANSLTLTSLHMQEAESRLKDADMAKEYMEFIKLQILNGTGSSMLAQANQNSQNVMELLLR